MFSDAFLDLVPPRAPSPPPVCAPSRTYSVELPDDVLRLIFEVAVAGGRRTARTLLRTTKWIHDWIARLVYTTVYIHSQADVRALSLALDRDLALVRNVWVRARSPMLTALLERMPNLERLAISLSAARMYGWAGIRDKRSVRSVFPASMRLREFEITQPQPGKHETLMYSYEFDTPALQNVTHMRLEYLGLKEAIRLGHPGLFYGAGVIALPRLTHLAFDALCYQGETYVPFESRRINKFIKKILLSEDRIGLRRLVIVLPSAEDCDARTRAAGILALRLSRLVVLVEPVKMRTRRLDWKARTLGQDGFWERAEKFGLTCTDE